MLVAGRDASVADPRTRRPCRKARTACSSVLSVLRLFIVGSPCVGVTRVGAAALSTGEARLGWRTSCV